jgi:hypothetical protein
MVKPELVEPQFPRAKHGAHRSIPEAMTLETSTRVMLMKRSLQ